jgi:Rab GDP dissociation inhibitor
VKAARAISLIHAVSDADLLSCSSAPQSHPIPDTNNAHSAQIILPQKQVGRKSDMYVFCSSYAHNVCASGKWLAFVSTTVETSNPEAELAPGLALLGPIDEKFVEVRDVYEPLANGTADKCFISKGYDATSHFETTVEDVLDMYRRITGKDLDLARANNAD